MTDSEVNENPEFSHLDQVNSLKEANEAIQSGMLLRVQPPAPGATRYYGVNGEGWVYKKAGHNVWHQSSTEAVRMAAKRALDGSSGVHCLHAVESERVIGE